MLLDFDGTICHLYPNRAGLDDLAEQLAAFPNPDGLTDPYDIFHHIATSTDGPSHLAVVAGRILEQAETHAARTAPAVAGFERFLESEWAQRAVVVTNNSVRAVRTYFRERHPGRMLPVVGRDPHRPGRQKPSPLMLHEALSTMRVQAPDAWFVGDAANDIRAAHAAGCRPFGMTASGRTAELVDADPGVALLADFDDLLGALGTPPAPRRRVGMEAWL